MTKGRPFRNGFWPACGGGEWFSGTINFRATWSPDLGQAEKMKTTSQAEFPAQFYALQVVLMPIHMMP